MEQRAARAVSRARTSLMLAGVLAAIALALALVGLYGVLSFGVAQRLREFGVRVALGAHPRAIRSMIVREGALLTACGTALGAAAAFVVVTTIRSSLYGTHVDDVRQYAIGVVLIFLCSALAYWLPARRASAVDPLTSLRAD
jgi:ABC-type antimicrobial peptide transport system permease subunit